MSQTELIILLVIIVLMLIKVTSWGKKHEKALDELIDALIQNGIKPSSFLKNPIIEKKEKEKK